MILAPYFCTVSFSYNLSISQLVHFHFHSHFHFHFHQSRMTRLLAYQINGVVREILTWHKRKSTVVE